MQRGCLHNTMSDAKLYNLSRILAKTKITEAPIRELLFAEDTALTSRTEDRLKMLVTHACKGFGITISLKRTYVTSQNTETPPNIAIDGYTLGVFENLTDLGSTISSSLSIDPEIKGRVAKAATLMAKLNPRV